MPRDNQIADGVYRTDGITLVDGELQPSVGSYLVEDADSLDNIPDAQPGAMAFTAGNRQRWQMNTSGEWTAEPQTALDTAVQDCEDARDEAVAAQEAAETAQAAAEAVRDSIPQDYTALSNSVGDLKSAVDEYGFYPAFDGRFSGTKYTANNAKYYLVKTIAKDCTITRAVWAGESNTPTIAVVRGATIVGLYPLTQNDGNYKTADVKIPCKADDMVFIGGANKCCYEKTDSTVESEKEFPNTNVAIGNTVTITSNPTVYLRWDIALYAVSDGTVVGNLLADQSNFDLAIDSNALKYKETDNQYELFGRWYSRDPYTITNNDGSQIFFSHIGASTVTLEFDWWKKIDGDTPYIVYSIDGGAYTRVQIASTVDITLPDTRWHSVRIMIDGMRENSAADSANKWSGSLWVAFKGVTTEGTAKGLMPANRVGVFFGDSLTEGVACLGNTSTAEYNSASNAYPNFCCKKMNAVPYYVGYGGSGLYNNGSFRPCATAVESFDQNTKTGFVPADFVVVNHGINDYSQTAEDFQTAYESLIVLLKKRYPDTPIFMVLGFASGIYKFAPAMKTVADANSKVYFVDTRGWSGATTDGTHLSPVGAQTIGERLADEILKVLGKEFFE